ncbi:DUF680 domain-containing protein [Mesorhizobium sp.]|uniref:DUF680 domain-containing protein n=1 Tax=Mesorhizobium sp. TaxID=1871066 RepID=UPI000FEA1A51|nr:DUF680 domain-containing protein [Mesorhizobium sp.]RWM35768.1 MAG: DUF680 domain-containing protein [Mesorhizobium sp.]TIO72681.1 MAG: DUF680 domain-containing protein [Mesorhizobium sp.]TIO80706.1 MAG: DUF680 domain-containing protein [Mesorhizobium sp.]TJV49129.1 MAG: DUF680 domain-containing protein [Mesorhizobium sp.]
MKHITLAAASLLVSVGAAFAGSDHYGSQTAVPPDNTHTSSTSIVEGRAKDDVRQAVRKPAAPNDNYGQGIWGR